MYNDDKCIYIHRAGEQLLIKYFSCCKYHSPEIDVVVGIVSLLVENLLTQLVRRETTIKDIGCQNKFGT